jgi:assimilatory nitrate reductase catalytic subunit
MPSAVTGDSPSRTRERSSRSCASRAGEEWPTTRASPTRRSSADGRLLALPRHGSRRTSDGSPGTPRLFEPGSWNPVARGAGPFYFADGKARFHAIRYEPPTEDVDAEYPVILTTGRVVSMFLSGNQTRRIGPLVDQYPEPLLELHPILAGSHAIADGDWVTVESRRGRLTVRCQVVTTIRPDVVFVPYHWGGDKSVNLATIAAQDPVSKIPEYKVCAVRIRKADVPPEYAGRLEPQQ